MDYAAIITYAFVITITPGPNNLMLTASGSNFGYRKTIPHILGICAGGSVQFLLTAFGLGAVFTMFPIIHNILLWAGLAYMLYLAWKILGIKVGSGKVSHQPLSFIQSFLFQFVNPKAWIAVTTEASVFLPQDQPLLIPILTILCIATFMTLPCCSFWVLFGKAMKRLLKTENNQRVFNVIMAALLVVTAVLIVAK